MWAQRAIRCLGRMVGLPRVQEAESTTVGRTGEALARRWFLRRGFRIMAQNFESPFGEVDLIATRGLLVVFVEVKTRRFVGGGDGEAELPDQAWHDAVQALVTMSQWRRIENAARHLMDHAGMRRRVLRFDLFVVNMNDDGISNDVLHVEGAYPPPVGSGHAMKR
ncbi:MAG: YraN family protein [Phycisphaerae bacterium]